MRETVFLHLCVLITALNSNFMFLLDFHFTIFNSWFQREMVLRGGGGRVSKWELVFSFRSWEQFQCFCRGLFSFLFTMKTYSLNICPQLVSNFASLSFSPRQGGSLTAHATRLYCSKLPTRVVQGAAAPLTLGHEKYLLLPVVFQWSESKRQSCYMYWQEELEV